MTAWVRWVLVAAIAVAGAVGARWELDSMPPPQIDVNMLFVPPAQVTKAFATGYENMIADSLWLGFLQYYGERLVAEDQTTENVGAMVDLITDLDPHFWFAYWLGAWALGDNHEPDKAIAILARGERLNPDDYNYPYLAGYIEFLFRKDYEAAARCFERTQAKPDAPRFAKTMAARMYQKQGLDQQALAVWESLYEHASDSGTRAIAKRNVERIKAEMAGVKPRKYKVGKPKPGEPL